MFLKLGVSKLAVLKINKADVKVGMILAEPVMQGKNVLVPEAVVLTDKMIDKIKYNDNVSTVLIFEKENENQNELKREYGSWELSVQEKYESAVGNVKKIFSVTSETKEVPLDEMNDLAKYTVGNLLKENFVLQSLKNLQSTDDYTYRHSINVGVLSGILATWLKYDEESLFKIVLSGLLHDIGKSQIPLDILNKPGKLLTEELLIMRKHPEYGYELLKNVPELDTGVKLAVLQHHERIDGKGYPNKLKDREIHMFSKIVAVADTYDAVTSNRVYQKARSPFSLLDIFQEDMFTCLDPKICLLMMAQIKNSLLGRHVILADDKKAKIVFIGSQTNDCVILKTEDGNLIDVARSEHKTFKDFIS